MARFHLHPKNGDRRSKNMYPGNCSDCGHWIGAGMGYAEYRNGSWMLHHYECPNQGDRAMTTVVLTKAYHLWNMARKNNETYSSMSGPFLVVSSTMAGDHEKLRGLNLQPGVFESNPVIELPRWKEGRYAGQIMDRLRVCRYYQPTEMVVESDPDLDRLLAEEEEIERRVHEPEKAFVQTGTNDPVEISLLLKGPNSWAREFLDRHPKLQEAMPDTHLESALGTYFALALEAGRIQEVKNRADMERIAELTRAKSEELDKIFTEKIITVDPVALNPWSDPKSDPIDDVQEAAARTRIKDFAQIYGTNHPIQRVPTTTPGINFVLRNDGRQLPPGDYHIRVISLKVESNPIVTDLGGPYREFDEGTFSYQFEMEGYVEPKT